MVDKKEKDEIKYPSTKDKNIIGKMIIARNMFYNTPKSKSGSARIAKDKTIQYYTLDDIVPIITKIEMNCGILCHISFEERGILKIFNADNPEEVLTYKTPVSINALGRGSEVQNIGAMETYARRYLYLIAFDIVEPEQIDELIGTEHTPQKEQKTNDVFITIQEKENIVYQMHQLGISDEAIKQTMQSVGLNKWGDLRRSQIDALIKDCLKTQKQLSSNNGV